MPDRITITLGMKVPGAIPYSSINFNFTYESDQKKDETIEETFERVKEYADRKCEVLREQYDVQAEHRKENEERDEQFEDY